MINNHISKNTTDLADKFARGYLICKNSEICDDLFSYIDPAKKNIARNLTTSFSLYN
jgi:hypothetical protein